VAGDLVFLSPPGAIVGVAAVLPLAAAAAVATQHRRVRARLGLLQPGRGIVEPACLGAVPLLLALAAAGPATRAAAGRPLLDSTEAIFVFDVSRSMAAAPAPHAPSRLDQAKAEALRLRRRIGDARAGVASITTQLLPELFPTADEQAFAETVDGAIGTLKPPPPAFQIVATTFDPLASLRDQGFFAPPTQHRVAILLTDGETAPFFPEAVGQRLAGMQPVQTYGQPQPVQPRVKLVVVRFGSARDRIYRTEGSVDAGYRPDLGATSQLSALVQASRGQLIDARDFGAATAALRDAVGSSRRGERTTLTTTTRLAPYAALAAFVPLGLLLWRRNLVALR